jgi:hypothetical protein
MWHTLTPLREISVASTPPMGAKDSRIINEYLKSYHLFTGCPAHVADPRELPMCPPINPINGLLSGYNNKGF